MSTRTASRSRTTKETDIDIELSIDGEGRTDIRTGLPFFDHMLDQLGRHGGFDLKVHASGDIEIDAHYFLVAPWVFPLAAAFEVFSGLSDLLVPGEEPAPLVFFLGQGALLLFLGFTRRRAIHRASLATLWVIAVIGVLVFGRV